MSESALTPHTAPRNLEALLRETPFKLRLLAGALGGLASEEQKMAWHQLQTNEARAEHILALLKGWDQANPGAARAPMTNGAVQAAPQQPQYAPAPQQPQPQMMQQPQYATQPGQPPPPMQAPQMPFQAPQQMQQPQLPYQQLPAGVQPMAPVGPAAVSPQAAAAAQAAAGEKPSTGRKPRNSAASAANAAAASADADVAAQVTGMLHQVLAGLGQDADRFQKLQASITSILEDASTAKLSRVTTLETKYGEVASSLQHLSAAVQSQSQVQLWTLMAFLTFMQESMGAPMTDILGAAIQDSAMFQQLVDKATGKA